MLSPETSKGNLATCVKGDRNILIPFSLIPTNYNIMLINCSNN